MRNKKGFTLTEMLIVIAILAIMSVILIGILNPISLVGKASDARRKNDLSKLKTAFEEYRNDKGFYPDLMDMINWNQMSNCGKVVESMKNYIKVWPCDPIGTPYIISTSNNWFRVVTNLNNKKDRDIPNDWYSDHNSYDLIGFTSDQANYGVSSPNINWYDRVVDPRCNLQSCLRKDASNQCDKYDDWVTNGNCESGENISCYYDSNFGCQPDNNPCRVTHCP